MGESVLKAGRREGGKAGDLRADPADLFSDAGIERRGQSLHAAGVALDNLAVTYGTPLYVYNADAIRRQFERLDSALSGVPHRICFAVKANSNLGVLRVLRDCGAGADIVSGGELARALAAGFAPERVVFSGVGKRFDELRDAVRARIGHINIESLDEIDVLAGLASAENVNVELGVRVNPDVTAETHPYISTGGRGIKFGVPVDQVATAAARIARHPRLRLGTIAMHLGSQLTDVTPFAQGLERLLKVVAELRASGVDSLRVLDVGGGLGIRYREETPLDPVAFAAAVVPKVRESGLTLYLEPGRFLVGAAGLLLTRILYRKHSGGKEFVIVDAGMNDLERPSRYQAYHALVDVVRRDGTIMADVVGPICETGDFFALDREVPAFEVGDLAAILGAGAYGFVMASNYNTRSLPAEVIVEGGRAWLARPRQEIQALFRDERVTPEDQ